MSKLSEIYEGWKNLTFPDPEIEKLAKKRIRICVRNKCDHFTDLKICNLCGCYMPAKVRSPHSKCNEGWW
jgi:hypothetical protein